MSPFPQRLPHLEPNPVTPSRRHLFAVLGLVLPLAAFTVSPAVAATSSAVHHKSHTHHVSASHKATAHHSSVHNAVHHTTHHTAKPIAS
jgi:hypothetical protein